MLRIEKDGHAFIFQKNDGIGDHLQVFGERGFQHLRHLQIGGFTHKAGIFESGFQHDLQISIFLRADISAAGTAENNNFGIFQL